MEKKSKIDLRAWVTELKEKLPLSQLASKVTNLKNGGREWVGNCPFHSEKTGSFYVNDQKGVYHCFGCGASGDHIRFVMDWKAKDFKETVSELATLSGMANPFSGGSYSRSRTPAKPGAQGQNSNAQWAAKKLEIDEQQRQTGIKLNKLAGRFFRQTLQSPMGEPGRVAFEKRGITPETREKFKLGYATDDFHGLEKFLRASQAPIQLGVDLGLLQVRGKDQGQFDTFRGRLIFPVFSHLGELIGFGGRAISPDQSPKYLNSKDSSLFHKSKLLYGLDLARPSIQQDQAALLVEGFMDVIACHQGGFKHAVATLGTSVSEDHFQLLKRMMAKKVIFLFDGDSAGQRALKKAAEGCFKAGLVGLAAKLPPSEDPDSILRSENGAHRLNEILEKAEDLLDYLIQDIIKSHGSAYGERIRAMEQILPWILKSPEGETAKTIRVKDLADRLQLRSEVLLKSFQGLTRQRNPVALRSQKEQRVSPTQFQRKIPREELELCRLLAHSPQLIEEIKDFEGRSYREKISDGDCGLVIDYAIKYGTLKGFPLHRLGNQTLRSWLAEGLLESGPKTEQSFLNHEGVDKKSYLQDILLKLELGALIDKRKQVTLERRKNPQEQKLLDLEFQLNRKIHELREKNA